MHRKEGDINTNEEGSEMNFGKQGVVSNSYQFTESVVNTGEDREDRSHRKYIVEVRNDVVGVVECNI